VRARWRQPASTHSSSSHFEKCILGDGKLTLHVSILLRFLVRSLSNRSLRRNGKKKGGNTRRGWTHSSRRRFLSYASSQKARLGQTFVEKEKSAWRGLEKRLHQRVLGAMSPVRVSMVVSRHRRRHRSQPVNSSGCDGRRRRRASPFVSRGRGARAKSTERTFDTALLRLLLLLRALHARAARAPIIAA